MKKREKGNDELLAETVDQATVEESVLADDHRRGAEESRLAATVPATDEPGEDYPDPDEAPA